MEVKYKVQFAYTTGGRSGWYDCGEVWDTFNQARSHLGYEMHKDPEYDYRIVKIVTSTEVVVELEAEG